MLITGAAGFIGSHIARRMVRENFSVHIIARKGTDLWRVKDVLHGLVVHWADLTDEKSMRTLADEINPDHIFHLAVAGLRGGVSLPEKDLIRVNLLGLMNILTIFKEAHYKSFINFGSSSEYGCKETRMAESDSCRPINAYGVTKLAATSYASFIGITQGKPIVTLRPFSPFGPYDHRERLISSIALKVLGGKDPVLAQPNTVRDYIFIDDVVDLSLEAMRKAENLCGEIFNVGNGKEQTTERVVNIILGFLGVQKKPNWGNVAPRPLESPKWEADMGKTFAVFDWRPRFSLEEGLHRTIEWFRENKHLYA